MPLNIKNFEVEELVDDVARITGETKTEAVRKALEERRSRLSLRVIVTDPAVRFHKFLEEEVWLLVPPSEKGRVMSREEVDHLLGFGEDGT